ncbi:hypothetical protein OG987_13190 [Streptomyces sp. NBC_01620]|uniref:hypothetical protein n=1 Tax=Streptomyces sp. NBC_01620 TaxID=2975902 RepID=UPI0038681309|nr:hypothetical protein OG987_13190 [Streptomyces sp. NBC_01620]
MNVLAVLCLAIAVYAASLVPFLLLVDADRLTPACLRRLPLTAAALLLLLGGTDAR